MKNKFVAVAALAALAACDSNTARITGQSVGMDSKMIRLEETVSYGVNIVDSTMTDAQGNYKFRIELPDGQPTLYSLHIDNGIIPLLVSPGEKVKIFSLPGNTRDYEVEGSRESSLIKEVNDILQKGAARLDSIANARSLRSGDITDDRREAMREYAQAYNNIKRDQIRFLVENSSSLAAIYALERSLPGAQPTFNISNDILYFRMVADSVGKTYPDSRYLTLLNSSIEAARASEAFLSQFSESIQTPVSFPEISLPDIYGVTHNLSENTGKVIILDFWSASEPLAATVNAEYKAIYNDFASRGLAIFQVNIDTSNTAWTNAVIDQKLPWISVSDLKGPASPVAGNYNIISVPANYVINANGDIVARNIFGEELRTAIEQLIIDN